MCCQRCFYKNSLKFWVFPRLSYKICFTVIGQRKLALINSSSLCIIMYLSDTKVSGFTQLSGFACHATAGGVISQSNVTSFALQKYLCKFKKQKLQNSLSVRTNKLIENSFNYLGGQSFHLTKERLKRGREIKKCQTFEKKSHDVVGLLVPHPSVAKFSIPKI